MAYFVSHCLLWPLYIVWSFKLFAFVTLSFTRAGLGVESIRMGRASGDYLVHPLWFSKGGNGSPEEQSGCLEATQRTGGRQAQSTEAASYRGHDLGLWGHPPHPSLESQTCPEWA